MAQLRIAKVMQQLVLKTRGVKAKRQKHNHELLQPIDKIKMRQFFLAKMVMAILNQLIP